MIYRLFFKLVFERIDAETAHTFAARVLRAATAIPTVRALVRRLLAPRDARLQVRAMGRTFPSPLGVAAGFDKDATWFESLGALGFGFLEVGTVTALPQPGNDRPRVFRLPRERAVVNRMGFPNPGAESVARRLARRAGPTIVGVNIGKTKVVPLDRVGADYRTSLRKLAPFADYVVLNVSSPNTPGLRDMQAVDRLASLIADAREEISRPDCRVPLLIKIGPDLSDTEIDAVADLAVTLGLDGIVAVNTTVDATRLRNPDLAAAVGHGGISGAPLKERALEVLQRLYARAGDQLVLISVGGIETPTDAFERILSGATLLQAHTGFVYGGPLWPSRMNRGLGRLVRDAGKSSIQELVGAAARPEHSSGLHAGGGPDPAVGNGLDKALPTQGAVGQSNVWGSPGVSP